MSAPGVAVGIDVASVSRVATLAEGNPRFTRRVYTAAERRHCAGHPQRWASRWAAKEAVRKLAGGRRLALPAFRDVEIALEPGGCPVARVRGWEVPVAVSLSHDGDWAVAVAVAGDEATGVPPPLLPVAATVRLPERPADGHKGTFGTVLVVGGAPGFSGAPYLAAMGAARGGAGLVRAAVPDSIHGQVAARCVEIMVHPLPSSDEGILAATAMVRIRELLEGSAALVVGPGITTGRGAGEALLALLDDLPCPVVVDADGLNIAARVGYDWRRCGLPVLLTPHPVEMARLTRVPVAEVQGDRVELARRYAAEHGVTVVLKGSGTVVAAPDGRVHSGPAGVVALATGGTGDVLAGLVGAMLAQGLEPFDAGVAGVTVHAEAGAAVQAVRGRAGALAGDLLEALPAAQERVRRLLESHRPLSS